MKMYVQITFYRHIYCRCLKQYSVNTAIKIYKKKSQKMANTSDNVSFSSLLHIILTNISVQSVLHKDDLLGSLLNLIISFVSEKEDDLHLSLNFDPTVFKACFEDFSELVLVGRKWSSGRKLKAGLVWRVTDCSLQT